MNKPLHILYVDDEPINLMLFKVNFQDSFVVHTTDSGENGLNILRDNPNIAALISDMKMPNMNGVEFIRKAKSELPSLPCFILTGFDFSDEITTAMKEKLVIKSFSKPYDKSEIENHILSNIQQAS